MAPTSPKLARLLLPALLLLPMLAAPAAGQGLAGKMSGGLPGNVKVGGAGRGGIEVLRRDGWTQVTAHGGIEARVDDKLVILADRAVFWIPQSKGKDAPPLRAIYAEGHVYASDGSNRVIARRVFFDLVAESALLEGLVLRLPPQSRGGQKGDPLFIRAERASIRGADELIAKEARVTACEFAVPHFDVSAATLRLTVDRPPRSVAQLMAGGLSGAALERSRRSYLLQRFLSRGKNQSEEGRPSKGALGGDSLSSLRDQPRWIEMDDVQVHLRGLPGPPLSRFVWKSSWDLFPKVRFGNSTRFGNFASLDWSIPILSRKRSANPTDGSSQGGRNGTSVTARFGGLTSSIRGNAVRGGATWQVYDEGRKTVDGRSLSTYLRDRAQDRNPPRVERQDRGWLQFAQKTEFIKKFRVDVEASRLSDRGYLLEFEERVAKTKKEQESYLYGHYRWRNTLWTALGRYRLNKFQEQIERLPEVTFDLFSQPLFVNPWLGGGATVSGNVAGSWLRIRRDEDNQQDLKHEELFRFDSQLELDEKVPLGPFQLRSFGRGRFSAFDHTIDSGGVDRFGSEGGANLNTTIWRPLNWWGLTHFVIPEIGYLNRFLNTRDPEIFLPIDEVEKVRETEFVFMRMRTRLARRRQNSRRTYDLVDFVVETRYFPKAGKDNKGENWSTVFTDLRLFLPQVFQLRFRMETDPNQKRVETAEYFGALLFFQGLELGFSYRDLRSRARALGGSVLWRPTRRWAFRFEEQYDFLSKRFLAHRATVRRNFHRLGLDFTLSVDPGENDVSFSVGFAPNLFGQTDPLRTSQIAGISY